MKSLKKMNHLYHLTFLKLKKPIHFLYFPYCEKNEAKSKDFIKKFHEFTNTNFRIAFTWGTRKLSSLFSLKNKNLHPSCKIYYEKCKQCGDYFSETKRNCITRWREHDNPFHKSEPARHINDHAKHEFEWSILCNAPIKEHLKKNLEALSIGVLEPSLNEQTSFDILWYDIALKMK